MEEKKLYEKETNGQGNTIAKEINARSKNDAEIDVGMTDEEIVKSLEHCSHNRSCEYCWHNDEAGSGEIVCRSRLMGKAIDLIHRLQSENESLKKQIDELPKPRKKILANRVYSDSTLKKWSKEDLIEQIRILEHNWACAEESLANSVKNSDKIFYEQKTEIERLTEENGYIKANADQFLADYQKVQKQVDELTEEQENMQAIIFGLEEEKRELKKENAKVILFNDTLYREKQQAVKETARGILQELWDETEPLNESHKWVRLRIKNIARRKVVEVK